MWGVFPLIYAMEIHPSQNKLVMTEIEMDLGP